MYDSDDWPKMSDGRDFDGLNLLTLVQSGNSPFRDEWNVELLIQEIEKNLCARVIDIPRVSSGSNNYVSCINPRGLSLQTTPFAHTGPGFKRGFISSCPMGWILWHA